MHAEEKPENRPEKKHLDEARRGAIDAMSTVLDREPIISAAVIVDDLFGKISVTFWLSDTNESPRITEQVKRALANSSGQFFSGSVSCSSATSPSSDNDLLSRVAWDEGVGIDSADRLRLNDRHRNHTSWFVPAEAASDEQCWTLEDGPPIVAYHGFKGGAGRTTLLASYAVASARRNRRVVVVDMDLDAPGVGLLLGADSDGTTARWGTVDFLLEANQDLRLDDYFHVCAREPVTREGRIEVFPAGALDDGYLPKLARVDLDVRTDVRSHPLGRLLRRIRDERAPDLILLDGRAGLSPAAGLLLSGIAHLHVLVATSNVQSLRGLERVIHHLGFRQARRDLPQRECVVVQAHVPDQADAARTARSFFGSRVEKFFSDGYYTKNATEDDHTWSLGDLDSEVAPHVPVAISYRTRFAHYASIDEVADQLLLDPDQMALHQRIDERLGLSEKADAAPVMLEQEDENG
jgi:MinD-like ATPase involved in chromosome partitioning or flagellar assembly